MDISRESRVTKPTAVTLLKVLIWVQFGRAIGELAVLPVLLGDPVQSYRRFFPEGSTELLDHPPVAAIAIDAGICVILALGALIIDRRDRWLPVVIIAAEAAAIVNFAFYRPFGAVIVASMALALFAVILTLHRDTRNWWRDRP
ncbi:MAG: hypothetical protein ACRD0P_17360 [Stackebrandtia sp.]